MSVSSAFRTTAKELGDLVGRIYALQERLVEEHDREVAQLKRRSKRGGGAGKEKPSSRLTSPRESLIEVQPQLSEQGRKPSKQQAVHHSLLASEEGVCSGGAASDVFVDRHCSATSSHQNFSQPSISTAADPSAHGWHTYEAPRTSVLVGSQDPDGSKGKPKGRRTHPVVGAMAKCLDTAREITSMFANNKVSKVSDQEFFSAMPGNTGESTVAPERAATNASNMQAAQASSSSKMPEESEAPSTSLPGESKTYSSALRDETQKASLLPPVDNSKGSKLSRDDTNATPRTSPDNSPTSSSKSNSDDFKSGCRSLYDECKKPVRSLADEAKLSAKQLAELSSKQVSEDGKKYSSAALDRMRSVDISTVASENSSPRRVDTRLRSVNLEDSVVDSTFDGELLSVRYASESPDDDDPCGKSLSLPRGSCVRISQPESEASVNTGKKVSVSGLVHFGPPVPVVEGDEDEEDVETVSSENVFQVRPCFDLDAARVSSIMRRTQDSPRGGRLIHRSNSVSSSTILERTTKWMAHPQSRVRLMWDVVAMFLLAYDTFMIPLAVFDMPLYLMMEIVAWFAALYWTVDIPATCCTGVYTQGVLCMYMPLVMRRYARTWLVFDVLTVLLDWLNMLAEASEEVGLMRVIRGARFLRYLRLFRLLRLVKVQKLLQEMKERVNNNHVLVVITIARLVFGIVVMIHGLACGWYLMGKQSPNGWVFTQDIQNRNWGDRYLFSFQWSMAYLHPSSWRSQLSLQTIPERIFAVCISLLAVGGGGAFISSITNTMAQMQAMRVQRIRRLWVLREFARQNRISVQLAVRVKKYVERSITQTTRAQNAEELANTLPDNLLTDLRFEAWTPILSKHPFVNMLCIQYPRKIWCLCKSALEEKHTVISDVIFTTGDVGTRMFFVHSGSFKYHLGRLMGQSEAGDKTVFSEDEDDFTVSPGTWLSEPCLWTTWEHQGEVVSPIDGTLIAIVVEQFLKVFRESEAATADMSIYASKFVKALNATDVLSDILPMSFTTDILVECAGAAEAMIVDCTSPRSASTRGKPTNLFALSTASVGSANRQGRMRGSRSRFQARRGSLDIY